MTHDQGPARDGGTAQDGGTVPPRDRQPLLHRTVTCLSAPAFAVSDPDGQIRGAGAHGFFLHDRRVLSRLLVTVDGAEPEPLGHQVLDAAHVRFVAIHRSAQDPTDDPVVTVERVRDARGQETITLSNTGDSTRILNLVVTLGCDLAPVSGVKSGRPTPPLTAEAAPQGLAWSSPGDGSRVEVTTSTAGTGDTGAGGTGAGGAGGTGVLRWYPRLEPRSRWSVTLTIDAKEPVRDHLIRPPAGAPRWTVPVTGAGDESLALLLRQSLSDLDALRLADPEHPEDQFLAAGCPWYLTLFGRDSIWAARMLLPLGTDLAAGTLRVLARLQGRHEDPDKEEEPGRILHELRRDVTEHSGDLVLPPRYYGSIDATPLFVNLLVDAWRQGLGDRVVEPLVPHAAVAMEWVLGHVDGEGNGFLRYNRRQGNGLVHRGWKDSVDAVTFADGRFAAAPIALCEVQGYAYQAAIGWADLLEHFGREGAGSWRAWADRLKRRFRGSFWVRGEPGEPYVAIALDGEARPVTGLASNMGHLPATGILDPDECTMVADRLVAPELNSGWGLRTRGEDSARFNPLSYHGGSVWVHDTAIAIAGLAATGHHEHASQLMDGLLDAAKSFDYRLPELYGGERRTPESRGPLPYPAACRPQAWAAASAVTLLAATRLAARKAESARGGYQST